MDEQDKHWIRQPEIKIQQRKKTRAQQAAKQLRHKIRNTHTHAHLHVADGEAVALGIAHDLVLDLRTHHNIT